MGGYSFRCAICGKWLLSGARDHMRGKHGIYKLTQEELEGWNARDVLERVEEE